MFQYGCLDLVDNVWSFAPSWQHLAKVMMLSGFVRFQVKVTLELFCNTGEFWCDQEEPLSSIGFVRYADESRMNLFRCSQALFAPIDTKRMSFFVTAMLPACSSSQVSKWLVLRSCMSLMYLGQSRLYLIWSKAKSFLSCSPAWRLAPDQHSELRWQRTGYRPLNLSLSCVIAEKVVFGPPICRGRDTLDFGHAFSNYTNFRPHSRIWFSSVQRAERLECEKRKEDRIIWNRMVKWWIEW